MSFIAPHVTDGTKFYSKLQKIRLVVLEVISTQISHRTLPAWLTTFHLFVLNFFLIVFNLLLSLLLRLQMALRGCQAEAAGCWGRAVHLPARRGCSGRCSLLRFETVAEKHLAERTASWEEPGARQKRAWEKLTCASLASLLDIQHWIKMQMHSKKRDIWSEPKQHVACFV